MKSSVNKINEEPDVLIIDDESDICQLLVLILKNQHLNAAYSNTLSEAKDYLSNKKPRLIFLDNHLPDGTGLEFISYIKSVSPDTMIVMITAHNTEANRAKAFINGAIHFIGKPFNSEEINDTIHRYFKSSNT